MSDDLTEGQCDCGGVRWTFQGDPGILTICNCGFCRRVGAVWAYGSLLNIAVEGATVAYKRAYRNIDFHHCPTCGAVTHWDSLAPRESEHYGRRAVNMRLADPKLVLAHPVERLDGADTWRSLEPEDEAAVPFLSF